MPNNAIDGLTVAIARRVTQIVAPDELDHFEEDLRDFRDDPQGQLKAVGDEPLGFGIGPAEAAAVAVILFLSGKVVDWVAAELLTLAKEGLAARAAQKRRATVEPPTPLDDLPVLTEAQAADLKATLSKYGKGLGLSEVDIEILTDAFLATFPKNGK